METGWVLDHLDDLDADFLRFYRTDYRDLDGPRFLELAHRVTAYGGVMAMRAQDAAEPTPRPPAQADQADPDVRHVPGHLLHLDSDIGPLMERVTV